MMMEVMDMAMITMVALPTNLKKRVILKRKMTAIAIIKRIRKSFLTIFVPINLIDFLGLPI